VRSSDGWTTAWWLVRDTFRQSRATGIGWLLAGISTIAILVCLSASVTGPKSLGPKGDNAEFLSRRDAEAHDAHKLAISGVAVADGTLRLAFGAIRVPVARDTHSAVQFLELVLSAGVADTLGLLLTLIWTAGFLPAFLDSRAVAVLLAKPVPRGGLLLGKYVGVLAFVLVQAAYFVGGTWLALGARTGIWDPTYLLSVPLLLLHFAVFFSVSLLLAVLFRSTVVSVFGSIAFWGLSWGINYGRHLVTSASDAATQGAFARPLVWLAEIGYWLFPKPIDLGQLLFDALGAGAHFQPLLPGAPMMSLGLAVLTSLLFTAYMLLTAGVQFARADY
jgi:ABC-type transport system involved in multi-copper enzyme maturation permease subunit